MGSGRQFSLVGDAELDEGAVGALDRVVPDIAAGPGSLEDVYRHHGLDADSVVRAALDLADLATSFLLAIKRLTLA